MNKKLSCPVCGSERIETQKLKQIEKEHSISFSYEKLEHICSSCGERGDFTSENDERYLEAYEKARNKSLEIIINDLTESNFSMAYIERALELSQRTLSRWKSKGISASGMALMRIVATYPWLLKVADNKFDKDYANKELVSQAANVFDDVVKKWQMPSPKVDVFSSEEHFSINMKWVKEKKEEQILKSTETNVNTVASL